MYGVYKAKINAAAYLVEVTEGKAAGVEVEFTFQLRVFIDKIAASEFCVADATFRVID
jgi:hypothetical protein